MASPGFFKQWGTNIEETEHPELTQQRVAKEAEALKLQTAPLSQALQADQTRLALYADPNDPTKAVTGKEKEYEETATRMTDTIGKLRALYGQKAPGQDPSFLDKLHITNHLKSHTPEGRAAALKAYADQNRSMAGSYAAGAFPYEMTPEGQAEAHKSAYAIKLAEAKAKTNYVNFKGPNGDIVAVDLATQTPPPGYVKAGNEAVVAKPIKAPEIEEKGGAIFITDPATGAKYSESNMAQAPPEIQRLFSDAITGQKAKEKAEENKESRRMAVAERLAEFRSQLTEKSREMAESSKIPLTIAGRMTQAQIIKEQIADLRAKLADRDLQKVMGPVAGRTLGVVASLYNKKVHDFYASQESLDALLPLLHGYRGGAQTHQVFKTAMGSLTIDPKAYEGTLDAIDSMADNIVNEVRDEYPNAPVFRGKSGVAGPVERKNRQAQKGGGTKPKHSLAKAMALSFNKGKSEAQVRADLEAHNYEVIP